MAKRKSTAPSPATPDTGAPQSAPAGTIANQETIAAPKCPMDVFNDAMLLLRQAAAMTDTLGMLACNGGVEELREHSLSTFLMHAEGTIVEASDKVEELWKLVLPNLREAGHV